ncbi:MAG: pyruvate, phosphate dikinase [Desulfobulbaceae bacterium]|nr:MAG: pyruvate, phosphate dikinase [Desulfobulbaceae bacterium]
MPLFRKRKTGDACQLLPALDPEQTNRYRRFRRLLEHNRTALALQADLEQIYYDNRPFVPQMVEKKSRQLLLEVDGMVNALSGMTGKEYDPLSGVLHSIERAVHQEWAGVLRHSTDDLVVPLADIDLEQMSVVGAKAANLAHIGRVLQLPTPQGFAVTTTACRRFLQETGLSGEIDSLLADLVDDDPARLETVSHRLGERILATPLPKSIDQALQAAASHFEVEQRFAVRSSAIGEDGEISFAGQYTSVLNVIIPDISQAYRHVIASLYSASALSYRMHHGLDDRETPMGVLILTMVQPQYSGVLYTADPTGYDQDHIRVSAVAGLGDQLVGGDASPERMFRLDKKTLAVLEARGLAEPDSSGFLRELAGHALRMEEHYRRPLDIEWAVDQRGRVFILQVRPLLVVIEEDHGNQEHVLDYPDHPLLLHGGKCAAGGVVSGRVLLKTAVELDNSAPSLEPDTILVARTASTTFTPWVSKVRGIITDVGGTASHLASVAREFGVPALFDTKTATSILHDGEDITLWASQGLVYRGTVQELVQRARQIKRPIASTPAHLRLQRLLDLISPLHLTDPNSADFSQERCRTVHDIIRYCHELSVRQMFNLGETIGHTRNAVRLKVNIPITLFALDMGGGLRPGLTTCDEINAHDVTSVPFTALWRGFSYPGINWSSAVAVGAQGFISLMAAGARPQDNSRLGGASYAILSGDYLNLNVRFGYHFATVDALCGTDIEHNYVTLSFAGGAGAYHGRSLRIQFLANVLTRLGFEITIKGDLIEASLMRLDQPAMETALDQLGRLLGTSRLLDMALKTPEQVVNLTESFFQGRYDFLETERPDAPNNFFLITGDWRNSEAGMEPGILQDGSHFVSSISVSVAQTMARFMGKRYQEFLDNIEAYCYFPLIIAKESSMGDGSAEVWIKPLAGVIDQAGGLAFAIRDWANYFVFRINALEDNAVLFEFRNGKRFERQSVEIPVPLNQWHRLRVETQGQQIRAFLNEQQLLEHHAERNLTGYLGFWTKADSVTLFKGLTMQPRGGFLCHLA